MFESAFRLHEYADDEPFEAAGFEVVPRRVLHYKLLAFGFRVAANGDRRSPTRATPGRATRSPSSRATPTSSSARRRSSAASPEGEPRGHLAANEAVAAFEESGAQRLLLTHRPHELPLEDGLEQAYDGLELEL